MSVSVKALDDNRSILVSYAPPYQPIDDVIAGLYQELEILRNMASFPAYIIVDISSIEMSFSDIVHGLGAVTQSEVGKEIATYDVRIVHIGNGDLVELGANGLGQQQYGGHQVTVFEDLAHALAHIESEIKRANNHHEAA